MLHSKNKSILVNIKALSNGYPLYIENELNNNKKLRKLVKNLNHNAQAIISPNIAEQLNLKKNDQINLGDKEFVIKDIIETKDSSLALNFNFAPEVLVGIEEIINSKLITHQSRISYQYEIKLPPNSNLHNTTNKLKEIFYNTNYIIKTYKEQTRLEQTISNISNYFSLLSLISILVSGIGLLFLYLRLIEKSFKSIGALRCLGTDYKFIQKIHLSKIFILSLLSFIVSILCIKIVIGFLNLKFKNIFPQDYYLLISNETIINLLIINFINCFLFCFPVVSSLKNIDIKSILSEKKSGSRLPFVIPLKYYLFLITFFYLFSLFLSNDQKITLFFVTSLLLSLTILSTLFFVMNKKLNKISKLCPPLLHLSIMNIGGNKLSSFIYFLSISMVTIILGTTPQLKKSVLKELSVNNKQRSDYFLFDIQEEQVSPLKSLIKNFTKFNTQINFSPLIQARLKKINHQDLNESSKYLKDKKNKGNNFQANLLKRTYNLSFRKQLSDSEKIIEGTFNNNGEITKDFNISLENKFAKRLGLNIGDHLTFDILGIEIEGIVSSIRHIRWTDFQPNFFVLFEQKALKDAPKTFLASIHMEKKDGLKKMKSILSEKFPNISLIDIKETISKVSNLLNEMSKFIDLLFILILFSTLMVLFGISFYQIDRKKYDLNILKKIGVHYKNLKKIILYEFMILSFFATFCGIFLSILISFFLVNEIFSLPFYLEWIAYLKTLVLTFCISIALSYIFIFSLILKSKKSNT